MPLQLVSTNADFDRIYQQWSNQCLEFDEVIENYAKNSLEHARTIVNNGAEGQPGYSIYSAGFDNETHCLLHVNRAELPGTVGITQKVLWVLLAPKYDYVTVTPDKIARVAFEVIFGALNLCKEEGLANHIKIHMGNLADREFFAGVAYSLRGMGDLSNVEIRGNWLHMTIAEL